MESRYSIKLDRDIRSLFSDALRISLRKPAMIVPFLKMFLNQRKAISKRAAWKSEGLHVPPVMIVTVTNKCNLKCAGCYAQAKNPHPNAELDPAGLKKLFKEALELGISMVLITGGEPLLHPELLDILAEFPQIVFVLFTNGMLLSPENIKSLKKMRHVVPVLSIEGQRAHTDNRRGEGVFDAINAAAGMLRKNGLFFGASLTVTSANFNAIFEGPVVPDMLAKGCGLFFFVEYVPMDEKSAHLVINEEQRKTVNSTVDSLRRANSALFFAFPSGEEDYGGCLAAGRGFIHVDPSGNIEPCPFSPVSDSNLSNMTLKDSLGSKLMQAIRENHEMLKETSGGCALWANREFVASLARKSQ